MSADVKAPIIEASALTKRFGGERHMFARTPTVHAVNDVSFAVNTGETFAIVGESGCGKSTLGRLLLRLIDATRGRVIYQGEDITHWQGAKLRRLRREMQIIFQDPFASLNPGMTVGQIIGEPVGVHGLARNAAERRERVAQLLTKVGLQPGYAERYPHEFSGGQRQRIGIARALAGEPKLIVGDEPVSALDVSVQAQVINLLESLKAELGLTLIMVAHDLAVIRHMSDRVAVMYLGEIVELAQVDELFDAPLHPYTQALLRAIPASSPHERRTKPALQGDLPSPTAPPPGCRFHTRCPHATPRCSQERPLAEALPGGRQVACHFWREVQNAGSGTPLAASVSVKLNERLEIYRDRQAALTAGAIR
ncbi:oligopeptide transporter subunit; ATP-binding component of ABC superfamily [Paraburkholderia piptadeniae]|uniref:Oligopeptide transporter subunit ATP-binding component of ABC superfamily n=1 Tax=Paraburkholderia piptadeniae TaxID=1701573 RepID=A0A1N7RPF5_9BURK|nr:oligopeptide/dipeptide ABC transporter ATP-binding protein [Paraburkholderia piptadeniae]SIT36964.1 oligopeptide transporter subunit; ATP-binding component of ABC superfamily [Paraburkholderia piptadeniae]